MRREYSTHFRAMGTNITVTAVSAGPGWRVQRKLEEVRSLFAEQEKRFSRFLPESELTRMNVRGQAAHPSGALWDVLVRARRWWEATERDFDPTILRALERAGYDRSFEQIPPSSQGPATAMASTIGADFGQVELAEPGARREVSLHNGVTVDLGGIVKGWTVDRAARVLQSFDAFLIDGGGDIYARGDSMEGHGWWIAVEDPFEVVADRAYVQIKDSAIATSGSYRRQWDALTGPRAAHHLIDPSSGTPSLSYVVSATVIAPDAETGDVLAKVALLRGPCEGITLLEGWPRVEGMLVLRDGSELHTLGWPGVPAAAAIVSEKAFST